MFGGGLPCTTTFFYSAKLCSMHNWFAMPIKKIGVILLGKTHLSILSRDVWGWVFVQMEVTHFPQPRIKLSENIIAPEKCVILNRLLIIH